MGRAYSISGADTNTVNTTIIGLTSAATVRPKIYDIIIGSPATPANMSATYALQRYTAAGTSTAFTPLALDPADPAALSSAGVGHSGEPTYTAGAFLARFAINQLATFRWVAAPGSELVLPATAANGAGLWVEAINGSAVTETVTILFRE